MVREAEFLNQCAGNTRRSDSVMFAAVLTCVDNTHTHTPARLKCFNADFKTTGA